MGWMFSFRKLAFSRGLGSLAQAQWRSVLQKVALAKAGSNRSGSSCSASDGAATVVEMEVGQEDVGDVVAVEAEGIKLKVQVLGDGGIMAEELLALLVAHAAVDEHQAVALLDQQGAQGPIASVPLVGGVVLRPEGLRDHAEHGAAVQLEQIRG